MKPSEDFHQKDLLNQFLASANIKLSNSTLDKLYAYADLVVETKEFGNLISEKDSQKFLSRHIADSLIPYIYIDNIIPVDPVASLQDDAVLIRNSVDPVASLQDDAVLIRNSVGPVASLQDDAVLIRNSMDPVASLQDDAVLIRNSVDPVASLQDDAVLIRNSVDPVPESDSDFRQNDVVRAGSFSLQDDAKSEPRTSSLNPIKWADMGAGAGCPVFPLAIAMPEIQFFAVEPRNMRVKFMQMVKEKLHLDNLTVVGKRFETSGLSNLDFISCRALSTFENDWERAMPALKKGGHFVTLKSFNNIVHLENDPAVHIYKYSLPLEEQVYALVTRGNE